MGSLVIIINHTTKEFFYPDNLPKWSEFICSHFLLYGIINHLKDYWNNCKIEFANSFRMDDLNDYKDISDDLDWTSYRIDFKEERI